MEFTRDDRGVSEVIGAILVFGLLIALLAVMQTYAIPLANEDVEFNHNQEVQSDFVDFQEATSRISSQGTKESVSISMGTTYPSRLLFFNPSSPSGEIRTVSGSDAEIRNVEATDPVINKYITQSRNLDDLQTKRIEYEPNYNEYQDSPTTVLEYGVLYRDFEDEQIVDDTGTVVNGNNIDLTFYDGDLARTTGSPMSLEGHPASAPARTVTVEPTASEMVIRLETRMSNETWHQILDDELDQNGGNVVDIDHQGDHVELHLDGSERYQLRMAKIGVGGSIPDQEPRYLVDTGGHGPSVIGMQSNTLPFEVRDRYNNPAREQDVNISVSRGQFANGNQYVETTTNVEGRPKVRYSAQQAGLVRVNASFNQDPRDQSVFDPENDPGDISFLMNIDPTQDDIDPVINTSATSIGMDEYFVCGGEGNLTGTLTCTAGQDIIEFAQINVDYSITETGSGLDSMNIEVIDGNGNILLTDAQGVSGTDATGIYRSAQVNKADGEPAQVRLIVTDNNGNTDTYSENV